MKRSAALVFVVAAVAALVAALLWNTGERRSMANFVAAGPMRTIELAAVRGVEIHQGGKVWRFDRGGNAWRADPQATDTQLRALDDALALLRNAAPERTFEANEAPDAKAVGLAPPQLVVEVDAGRTFAVAFGGANPMGQARYARVDGDKRVLLLPRYVADMWEAAAGLREPPTGGR